MKRISWVLTILVVALVVGGAAFLATWNIPAPVSSVEKVIPDDRLPR